MHLQPPGPSGAACLDMVLSYPDPTLTEAKVTLRPWLDSDLPCVKEASVDGCITAVCTMPKACTPAEGLAFIDRQRKRFTMGEGLAFAVTETWSGEAVGHAELLIRPRRGIVSIQYWLLERRRGNRLGLHAVLLLSRWVLEKTEIERIDAFVEATNIASIRVLERASFQQESARAPRDLKVRGADLYVYSLSAAL